MKQQQEELKLQKQIEQKKQREEIRQKQKEEILKEKEKQAKEKEQLAKQKREELQRIIDENQKKREKELEVRKSIMEQKDNERRIGLEKKRQELIEKAKELQELHQQRIELAKQKNEIELEKKKEQYNKKQVKLEEKRIQFEQQIENERQLAREKAEEQKLLIQKVLEQNELREKQRQEEYIQKQKIAEERKQELDHMYEEQKKIKQQMEIQKEEERKQVKEKKQKLELQKKMTYLKQFELAKERLQQAQQRQAEELKQKQNDNIIKQKEKLDTVQCILRKRDYYQEKLKERLFRGTQKAFALKKQMDDVLNLRTELRREIDLNKRNIMDKFEKIKQGKIDPEVLGEFGLGDKATQLIKAIKEARNLKSSQIVSSSQEKEIFAIKRNYLQNSARKKQVVSVDEIKKNQSTSNLLPAISTQVTAFKSETPQRSEKSFKQQLMTKTFSNDRDKKISLVKLSHNKSYGSQFRMLFSFINRSKQLSSSRFTKKIQLIQWKYY